MDANKKARPHEKGSMKKDKQTGEQKAEEETIPHHTSQGHSTGAKGSATNSAEPTLRSATTDSSRVPKNSNDDLPEGGNIR
ncbi:hypothetical protein [Pontibacter beigongshangensis]|uniref:hypothetical protein n=1 Tax=Pontibacter beigongshangensis TaxID=2574733 RepID=UPI001650437E|nr:hypothetical protein [Pontibacter beigongshangensis]